MKWSMDTHKYMSEITRKALKIMSDEGVNSHSSAAKIEAVERKLAEAGVYKDFDSARGRIRRALFTYFKAYDCLDENEQLTEIGSLFSMGELSLREFSFSYILNYKYKDNDIEYYPAELILKCLVMLKETESNNDYLTPHDFSVLTELNGLAQLNDEVISNICASHSNEPILINERTIGYDVWAKMLIQASILYRDDKKYLRAVNYRLIDWIISSYNEKHPKIPGKLCSGVIKGIPLITLNNPTGKIEAYTSCTKPIQAYLFDSVDDHIIDKYIFQNEEGSFEKLKEAFGFNNHNKGFYSVFSGLERLVGFSMMQRGTPLVNALGKIIARIEITEDDLSELLIDTNNNHPSENSETNSENDTSQLPNIGHRKSTRYPLNFILYGAPGTGKTYTTSNYAVSIIEDTPVDVTAREKRSDLMSRYYQYLKDGKVVFTTFHQNYGYEDFIEGIRPNTEATELSFNKVDGIFKTMSARAMNDTKNNYVIIIDEINRANISKVFGELITLIEEDKRWGEENAVSVTLPSGDLFAVPNNLYIVGTMNSADKSISLIDTALRRRFSFVEFVPELNLVKDPKLRMVLERLNTNIVQELNSTDLLIGHSYFMNKEEKDLCEIMNRSIIPLLYEYFFDNQKKVEAQVKSAVDGLDVSIKTGTMGRIKLKRKDA